MKHIRRLFLSVLTAVLLILCTFSGASALTSDDGWSYTINSDGISITITGYSDSSATALSVPFSIDGKAVTIIGYSAFKDFTSLKSIVLPEGVTAISDGYRGNYTSSGYKYYGAFSGCINLESISLPSTLTSIGSYTFYGCSSLDAVPLPDNITYVGTQAVPFIPSVTPGTATSACFSYEFYAKGYPDFLVSESTDQSGAFLYTLNSYIGTDAAVTVPPFIHILSKVAFYGNTSVKSIVLPEGLISIAEGNSSYVSPAYQYYGAFSGCANLESVSLPSTITSIGAYAFYGCASLRTMPLPSGLISIGNCAFSGCSFEELSLPDSVTELNGAAFSGLTGLKRLRWTAGVPIVPTGVIPSRGTLESVVLPEGVTELESVTSTGSATSAFYNCTALKSISLPSTLENLGRSAFSGCSSLSDIVLPEKITSIPDGAFYNCDALKSIALHDKITSIGQSAFSSCDMLASVSIPDSVETIGYQAFSYCTSLTDVTLPKPLTTIEGLLFYGCTSLKTLVIPENVTSLGSSPFDQQLEHLYLPDNITSYAQYDTFRHSSPRLYMTLGSTTAHTLGSDFSYTDPRYPDFLLGTMRLSGSDGSVTAHNTLHAYYGADAHVDIPEGISYIPEYKYNGVFLNNTTLVSVTLPESMRIVHPETFEGCTSLTTVRLNDGLQEISGFRDCSSLTELHLPDNLTYVSFSKNDITLYARYNSTTAASLGKHNFKFIDPDLSPDIKLVCPTLEDGTVACLLTSYLGTASSLTVPQGITGLDKYALQNQAGLVSLSLPEGMTSIGDYSLANCTSLSSVSLPSTLQSIGAYAFNNCDVLTRIEIPDHVSSISASAFSSCDSLVQITLPQSLTAIGDSVFNTCPSLTRIEIPDSVTSIGENAFSSCRSLTEIHLPLNLTSIGTGAFRWCDNLVSLSIPAGVTALPDNMAYINSFNHNPLSVVIPASVTSISSSAFADGAAASVYCYRGSYADTWAQSTGRTPIYIGEADITDYMDLTGIQAVTGDHGTTFSWRDQVVLHPVASGSSYTLRCTSSNPSVASVSGNTVSILKAGSADLTVTVDELPWLSHVIKVTAYNPVESFTFPSAYFMKVGDYDASAYLKPQNVVPDNTNPKYTFKSGNYSTQTSESYYAWPSSSPNVTSLTVSAQSGVTRASRIVTYAAITQIRFKPLPARIGVGVTIVPEVIVFVDNTPYVGESALYTLSSSDSSVLKVNSDNTLTANATGTATITVRTIDGQTAAQTVSVVTQTIYTLPAALLVVEEEAFAGSPVEIVNIPSGCTAIKSRAFADCGNLVQLSIPASVLSIADDAFSGCSGITIIAPEGSAAQTFANTHDGFVWQAP